MSWLHRINLNVSPIGSCSYSHDIVCKINELIETMSSVMEQLGRNVDEEGKIGTSRQPNPGQLTAYHEVTAAQANQPGRDNLPLLAL